MECVPGHLGLAAETSSPLAAAFAPLNFKGAQSLPVTPSLKTTREHVLSPLNLYIAQ